MRPSRSSPIVNELREQILTGSLPEGSRLTEMELSKRFGVGRGLVREALQQLSHQGLLINRPNRGAVVAPEPPKAIRELIVPIRQMVEGYALEQIFDELNEADFQQLDDLVERMREACEQKDMRTIAELDIAFHRAILERAGQPDLLAIWEAMVYRIRSHFRRMQRRCPDPMEIYEEHRAIVVAIRTAPVEAAVQLLKDKIA